MWGLRVRYFKLIPLVSFFPHLLRFFSLLPFYYFFFCMSYPFGKGVSPALVREDRVVDYQPFLKLLRSVAASLPPARRRLASPRFASLRLGSDVRNRPDAAVAVAGASCGWL